MFCSTSAAPFRANWCRDREYGTSTDHTSSPSCWNYSITPAHPPLAIRQQRRDLVGDLRVARRGERPGRMRPHEPGGIRQEGACNRRQVRAAEVRQARDRRLPDQRRRVRGERGEVVVSALDGVAGEQRCSPVADVGIRVVEQRPQLAADWPFEAVEIRRDARQRVPRLLEGIDERRRGDAIGHPRQQRQRRADDLLVPVVDRASQQRRHRRGPGPSEELHRRDAAAVVPGMSFGRGDCLERLTSDSRHHDAGQPPRAAGIVGAGRAERQQDALRKGGHERHERASLAFVVELPVSDAVERLPRPGQGERPPAAGQPPHEHHEAHAHPRKEREIERRQQQDVQQAERGQHFCELSAGEPVADRAAFTARLKPPSSGSRLLERWRRG